MSTRNMFLAIALAGSLLSGGCASLDPQLLQSVGQLVQQGYQVRAERRQADAQLRMQQRAYDAEFDHQQRMLAMQQRYAYPYGMQWGAR